MSTAETSAVMEEASPVRTAGLTTVRPDPEVVERPARWTFTAEFKRRVVEEAEACVNRTPNFPPIWKLIFPPPSG